MCILNKFLGRFFGAVRSCVDQTPDRHAHIRQSPIQKENPYSRQTELHRIKERLDEKVKTKAQGSPNTDAKIFNHPRR